MRVEHARPQPLAEVDLRLKAVGRRLEFDDVELQAVERAAHVVVPVLRLDDDLVIALRDRPDFLLFRQRAEVPLAAPVEPRGAEPVVEDLAALELDRPAKSSDEIEELRILLLRAQLV